ncbi:MAG: hypothetical protein HOK25_15535 [Rhodospirillaceae bacterium]|nr:hypothetical protein [Rhodospirillaceae bacterium]MBT5515473.1 hypothetical protein [Rhodospirillaceae bacterium]
MRQYRFIYLVLFVTALTPGRLAFANFDSGYNAYLSGDYGKALEIWTKAASPRKNPDLWSAYMAGVLHETGRGTERNIPAAKAFYTKVYRKLPTIIADKPTRKKALALPIDAVFRFAMIKHVEARRQEEKDGGDSKGKMVMVHQEARIMLDRAGFYGHAEAFYNRAVITELGIGRRFARDKKTAWALYTLAGAMGFQPGVAAANAVEAELSDRKLKDARKNLASYRKYMVADVGYKWRNVTGEAPLVLTPGDDSMPAMVLSAMVAPPRTVSPAKSTESGVAMAVKPVSPLGQSSVADQALVQPTKPVLRKPLKLTRRSPAAAPLDSGWAAIGNSNFQPAIRRFTRALKSAPNAVAPLWGRAWAYENIDNFSTAIDDYSMILKRHPGDGDPRFSRAMAYYQSGSYAEAAADLAQMLESAEHRRRQYALIWYYLSRRQQGTGSNGDAAVTELARLIRESDLDGDLGNLIGVYLGWADSRRLARSMGNDRTAAERTRRCVVFYHLGVHHLLKHELPTARRYFGKAVATNAASVRQFKLAARALARLRGNN